MRSLRLSTTASHWLLWVASVVVIVGPLAPILVASLWSTPLYESGGNFTTENYRRLVADPQWWDAVVNSLVFASVTTAGAVVIGGTAAVLCSRTNLAGRKIIGAALFLPLTLPGLVLILGWSTFWSPSGYGSNWIAQRTPFAVPFDLYSVTGMSLVGITVTTPVLFFIVRSALNNVDSSLEESARSSGASPLRVLRTVTIPLLRPAFLNSSILIFALGLEVLGLPLVLGSSSGVELVGTYLYRNWVQEVPPDQGLVSAGGMVLLLAVSGMLYLRNLLAGDMRRYATVTGKPRAMMKLDLGRGRWILGGGYFALIAFAVVAPLAAVVLAAFTRILTPFINPFEVLTTEHFSEIFSNDLYIASFRNSLFLAIIGGSLTTVIIAVLSLVAHRSDFPLRTSMQQAMLWPRAVPGIVTGMAFFWSFVIIDPHGWLRGSLVGLGIAFAVRNIALAYSAFYPTLAGIGFDMERAARTSGASWWRAATGIVLRLAQPAIAVSFVLLFVSILNEYDPAVFLVTPDTPVMGLTMLNLSLTGVGGVVAAFGVLQMLITVIVLGLGRLLLRVRPYARR